MIKKPLPPLRGTYRRGHIATGNDVDLKFAALCNTPEGKAPLPALRATFPRGEGLALGRWWGGPVWAPAPTWGTSSGAARHLPRRGRPCVGALVVRADVPQSAPTWGHSLPSPEGKALGWKRFLIVEDSLILNYQLSIFNSRRGTDPTTSFRFATFRSG